MLYNGYKYSTANLIYLINIIHCDNLIKYCVITEKRNVIHSNKNEKKVANTVVVYSYNTIYEFETN